MNSFIRLVLFVWLMVCAIFAWIGSAALGALFFFSSNMSWVGEFAPFITITCGICIIKCAFYVLLKSDPIAYMDNKVLAIRRLLGKEKI